MNDSIKLMRKDLSLSFKTNKKFFYVFFYPMCMSSLIITGSLTASVQIIMCAAAYAVYGIVVGLIATNEKTKSDMIFQSLPIKKKSIVAGKYLFTVSVIFVSCLLSSVIPIIKSIIEKDASYALLSFLNSFMFCTVLFSMFYPLYYRFGYLKMQVINYTIFYGLIFIPIMLNLLKDVALLKPIVTFVFSFSNILIQNTAISFVLCTILYILSMIISMNINAHE